MRCLALAQAWRTYGGQSMFVSRCESSSLRRRLMEEGCSTTAVQTSHPHPSDAETLMDVLREHSSAAMVLDGYHFDVDYQRQIRRAGVRLLAIDDMAHLPSYEADIILNQNIYADEIHYACPADTRLLLGTRYVLLRREFWAWRDWQRKIVPMGRRVLVTMGGADPDNATVRVIDALEGVKVPQLEARVLVGASNPHLDTLRDRVANCPIDVRLVENASDVPSLMAWADLAVSAAGSTCWELAFMGLPAVLVVLADNQEGIATGLAEQGMGLRLGCADAASSQQMARSVTSLLRDVDERQKMSTSARRLVDGHGAERVVQALLGRNTADVPALGRRVRRAGLPDAELLWTWANDPSVRACSLNPDPIPWETHVQWFRKKLQSPQARIWVLEVDQVAVGQIRYDRCDPNIAEISFCVDGRRRGEGLGTSLIALTIEKACRELEVETIRAVALIANSASRRVFEKSGFRLVATTTIAEKRCHVFERPFNVMSELERPSVEDR